MNPNESQTFTGAAPVAPAPQPVQVAPEPVLVDQKPIILDNSKKSKAPTLFAILFLIIAIGAAAFGAYELLENNNKNNEIATLNSKMIALTAKNSAYETKKEEENYLNDLLEEVRAAASDKRMVVSRVNSGSGAFIKLEGMDSYTLPTFAYVITTPHSTISIEDHDAAISLLVKNGFEQVDYYMSGIILSNSEKKTFCSVDNSGSVGGEQVIACANVNWIDAEKAELVGSLEEAVQKAGVKSFSINALPEDIQNSEISPYQKLSASAANSRALFYRASEEADWVFLGFAQSPLMCSDYTDDAAKAFVGEICALDHSAMSTVQAPED